MESGRLLNPEVDPSRGTKAGFALLLEPRPETIVATVERTCRTIEPTPVFDAKGKLYESLQELSASKA